MKRLLITLSLISLLTACLVANGIPDVQELDEIDRKSSTESIFENVDTKQTADDFNPAPDTMKTDFGDLLFLGGAFPDEQTVRRLYDELDLQRATQAYMDFYPAMSVFSIIKAQIRDFGFRTSSDIGVMADFMEASENYLTGNDVTVYSVASLDLKVDGATVVEIPPGMLGTANDALFEYLTDFGVTGPDKGEGGKYLFLPPGYDGAVPDGYFVFRSRGYRVWVMMRGFGEVGYGDQAVTWFKERFKVYPLESGPRDFTAVNTSGMGINSLTPEDASAFEMIDDIIQYEPNSLFDDEQLGRLATLGIVKGQSYSPDARMLEIFEKAAQQATAMSRAILYASREPDINYWADRHWEKMFVRNTEFSVDGHNDIDARTLWHYQAIVVSPNLISTTPGVGTAYLTSFRDDSGSYLNGGRKYKLTVPANVPVKRFWAVTAYDPVSRSLLPSEGPITVGSLSDPDENPDGSVDIFFGPGEAPRGLEKNWVRTQEGKGFFVVFRFYGPTEGYIEKTWTLSDFELVD